MPPKINSAPEAPEWVQTDRLLLDPENPRLVEHTGNSPLSQSQLLKILWENMAVDELALSIKASGYFEYEPLFVVPEGKFFVVIEGNRRLAAVKLLLNEQERTRLRATDLPPLTQEEADSLKKLPVIKTQRRDAWQYLGFKHVNGPAKWDSFAKAQYVAQVHNVYDVPLQQIALQIGDKHQTVARFYRALMVLEQAEKAKVFTRENRYRRHFSFSHLYTGLDYEGVAGFIELRDKIADTKNPVPAKKLKCLGELLRWIYGDKTLERPPVVESQNPHLRQLDEVLKNPTATEALRAGLPLNVALEVSYGDEKVFSQALHHAKEALQKARGTLSTGFTGQRELLSLAESILDISDDLVAEMNRKASPRTRAKGSREVG